MESTEYILEYDIFLKKIESGMPVEGSEVGMVIAKFAQYFGVLKQAEVAAEYSYNKKLIEFEQKTDENGKALSSTKAENFAKATEEYKKYMIARAHVASIEQMLNALKSLQRGVLNEYSYSGNQ